MSYAYLTTVCKFYRHVWDKWDVLQDASRHLEKRRLKTCPEISQHTMVARCLIKQSFHSFSSHALNKEQILFLNTRLVFHAYQSVFMCLSSPKTFKLNATGQWRGCHVSGISESWPNDDLIISIRSVLMRKEVRVGCSLNCCCASVMPNKSVSFKIAKKACICPTS